MTSIVVVNASTSVTDADVATAVAGCAIQLATHAAPAWGKVPINVTFGGHVTSASEPVEAAGTATAGDWVIAVMDNSDQANALGWHTETAGELVFGRVFAAPILSAGGSALSGQYSVSATLSHELLETFIDPSVSLWADDGSGNVAYAYEVADPVEDHSYEITLPNGTTTVAVSDFVLPTWFDAKATGVPVDWCKVLTAPFTMTTGGYVVKLNESASSQQMGRTISFGENYPDWRKATKTTDTARSYRRMEGKL
jgi:hypothetical protein